MKDYDKMFDNITSNRNRKKRVIGANYVAYSSVMLDKISRIRTRNRTEILSPNALYVDSSTVEPVKDFPD